MWMKTGKYPLYKSDKPESKLDLAMVRETVSKSISAQLSLSASEREVLKTVFMKGVTKCVHR